MNSCYAPVTTCAFSPKLLTPLSLNAEDFDCYQSCVNALEGVIIPVYNQICREVTWEPLVLAGKALCI